MSPGGVLWGVLQEYGVPGLLLRAIRSFYNQCEIRVRILGTKSNTFSVGVGLHQSCLLSPNLFVIFMDGISRRSRGEERVRFGTSELHLCSQVMWLCWLHQTVTSSTHWGGLQTSVKWLGRKSAPLRLRPWFSAGKWWTAPFGLGVSYCLKRRSSGISGSCLQMRAKWSVRSTGGLVRWQQ